MLRGGSSSEVFSLMRQVLENRRTHAVSPVPQNRDWPQNALLSRVALLALALIVSLPCKAQPTGKPARIGMLVTGPPPAEHACVRAFQEGMSALGYVEGVSYLMAMKWSLDRPEEAFPRLGSELVKSGVDLIVTVASQGVLEAKSAISSVPVVMAISSYPVERKLVDSLSRPGGNITGLATFSGELYAKRIQLLAEALPGVSRVAILRVAGDMGDFIQRDLELVAHRMNLKLDVIDVKTADDFAGAFEGAIARRAQAVMTTQSPFFYENRRVIAALALRHRLPSFSGEPLAAEAGMLITHGANIPDNCRRAATYADRILKGAKPADLPLEQPTRFELVINRRTANALGIVIPPALFLRADRVIE